MKKIILILGLCLTSMFSFANLQKTNITLANDSATTIAKDVKPIVKTYKTTYYDIVRLVVFNEKHAELKVVDTCGNVILETTGNVDIKLAEGNYTIFSTVKIDARYALTYNR